MRSRGQEYILNALSKEIKAYKLNALSKEIKAYKRRIALGFGDEKDKRKLLYDARLKRRQYAAWCVRPGKRANRFKRRYRQKRNPFLHLLEGKRKC